MTKKAYNGYKEARNKRRSEQFLKLFEKMAIDVNQL
jgi:hypothetical protein